MILCYVEVDGIFLGPSPSCNTFNRSLSKQRHLRGLLKSMLRLGYLLSGGGEAELGVVSVAVVWGKPWNSIWEWKYCSSEVVCALQGEEERAKHETLRDVYYYVYLNWYELNTSSNFHNAL